MNHTFQLLVLASSVLIVTAAPVTSRAQQEDIFVTAPFASAHASTVVELAGGSLMACWFGGSAEGAPDVAIWCSQKNGAAAWSAPLERVRERDIAAYNPVLFHSRDGRLWLYYKFGPHPTSWSAGRMFSTDEGKTWSPAEHLPAGMLGPIRTKPLVESNGTIVSGSSVESYRTWAVWIERSTDDGKTWIKRGPIAADALAAKRQDDVTTQSKDPYAWNATTGIIQPAILALGPNHLRLYARSTANIGKIVVADSADDGLTWSSPHALDILNPNAGIDAVTVGGGVVLIYNDSATQRTPLKLAFSRDGEHFTTFQTLEQGPGEFSYPAMIVGRNGDLHLTYTWNRKRIRYVHLAAAKLQEALRLMHE